MGNTWKQIQENNNLIRNLKLHSNSYINKDITLNKIHRKILALNNYAQCLFPNDFIKKMWRLALLGTTYYKLIKKSDVWLSWALHITNSYIFLAIPLIFPQNAFSNAKQKFIRRIGLLGVAKRQSTANSSAS